jgi:hypothetical protein
VISAVQPFRSSSLKNPFLSPEQDDFRNGLEAALAYELSYSLPRKRILEPRPVLLWPATLEHQRAEAAMLAFMLPHPEEIHKHSDGTLVYGLTGSKWQA